MGIFSAVKKLFEFDSVYDTFELLEKEQGDPSDHVIEKHVCQSSDDTSVISDSLSENINTMRDIYHTDICKDLVIREFLLCKKVKAAALFLNGLSDSRMINDFILRDGINGIISESANDLCSYAAQNVFTINDIKISEKLSEAKESVRDGLCVVFIEGCNNCIIADTRLYPDRSVDTSENEKGVFGPKDSFTENIRTNISLIRRHVHTTDLVCELRPCGDESRTSIGILFRDEVASPALIAEVKKRIASIDTEAILSTGMITQLTDNSSFSPLPQSLLTERPDRCASYLNSGHVVILCDTSPVAAIVPVTLSSLLTTAEDVYARPLIGGIMRLVRLFGALISITVPGIFIAVVMHHQGFLSSEILTTIISSRKMVFIPIGAELILLLLIFQLVREAGMRVPGSIGQAIGIIGGLVLGQAVVAANLASSVVLIVVALTGLGTFCIPDYSTSLAAVWFRLLFVFAGWAGGFLGLTSAFLLFIAYMCNMKSYGVPFLSPFAPKTFAKRGLLRGIINKERRNEDYMN